MNEKNAYWSSVILGAIALLLLIVNISLATINRGRQVDVAARQTTLNNAQALGQINQALIQSLAEAVLKNGDSQIRELLSSQGVTVKENGKTAEKISDSEKEK